MSVFGQGWGELLKLSGKAQERTEEAGDIGSEELLGCAQRQEQVQIVSTGMC